MQKKIARVVTEKSFPRLFQKELKKSRLNKVGEHVDAILDASRIIRDNEQNLKDLGGLKHRLDTLDKIMITVDKIAGGVQAIREEQTLHVNVHDRIDARINRLEKHTKLLPLAD